MSENETLTDAMRPARPHPKLTRNAKGDTQLEVGLDAQDSGLTLEEASRLVQAEYDALCAKYPLA